MRRRKRREEKSCGDGSRVLCRRREHRPVSPLLTLSFFPRSLSDPEVLTQPGQGWKSTCLEMVPSHGLSTDHLETRPGIVHTLVIIPHRLSHLAFLLLAYNPLKQQFDADLPDLCSPFFCPRLLCLQLCHNLIHIQLCCLCARDHSQGTWHHC